MNKRYILLYLFSAFILMASPMHAAANIGCDDGVHEASNARKEALQQQEVEAAKAMITQPTPVEQLTCFDQHTEVVKAATKTHSNKDTPNTTIATIVQQPLAQTMLQFFTGNLAGSISSMINQQFSAITSSFTTALGGLGGGIGGAISAPTTNCNMQEEAWLIAQCIQMPQLPSLSNIIGGKLGELAGVVGGLANPERLLEKVCESANSKLGEYMGDLNGAFDKATEAVTKPLSDAASALQ